MDQRRPAASHPAGTLLTPMVTTFTVLQVAEHIERQVTDVWDRQFWVRGEVSGLKRQGKGVWFDLVHTTEDGQVVAQLNVSMPASKGRLVDRRLAAVGQPLEDGLEIRIKANLQFWVRGGRLSLSLADIDPSHTAGALALARRDLLAAMQADGSFERNRRLPTPRVPLSLGLVTSSGSQAFHDLVEELRASGLPFRLHMISTRVQGPDAPPQIVAALRTLAVRPDIDLVLLTRGGGAEVDLMTFDHADVARGIAECRVPVWTGIGHHLDQPVAELVAARAHKTPTALAQGVVATVREAADDTEQVWADVRDRARRRLDRADRALSTAARRTAAARTALRGAHGRVDAHQRRLQQAATRVTNQRLGALQDRADRLQRDAPRSLQHRADRLSRAERLVALADPDRLIQRGWTVTTRADDGGLVTGPLPAGTVLHTRTREGTITSEVIHTDDR